jgi:adenylate cyclase
LGIEIERKFLLAGDGWRASVERSLRMVQGYLGGDRCSVRVRIEGAEARLNIKSRTLGAVRTEYEYPLPVADAEDMLARFCPERVEKIRHYVQHGGRLWEIDEFAGRNAGLVVAELELGAVDEAYERPAWLGREVTDDPRYYNTALATTPWSVWGAAETQSG